MGGRDHGSVSVGIDPGRYEHGSGVVLRAGEVDPQEGVANEAAVMEGPIDRITGSAGGPGSTFWVTKADGGNGVVSLATSSWQR